MWFKGDIDSFEVDRLFSRQQQCSFREYWSRNEIFRNSRWRMGTQFLAAGSEALSRYYGRDRDYDLAK
jgi:hypothetical protein